MDEKPLEKDRGPKGEAGMDRRHFLAALGAAGVAGAFLAKGTQGVNAAAQQYYYEDSFGNILPAGEGAIELGIYPPPITYPNSQSDPGMILPDGSPAATPTFYAPGYPVYNILLIIVDQMRNPAFWLPSSGQAGFNNSIPNISALSSKSFYFPHYYTAATVCGPSRACLLTGLYSQQQCIFRSSAQPLQPYNNSWTPTSNANPGFPTIANVLSQSIAANNNTSSISYDCTWIGKWHLSCLTGISDGSLGGNGPSDYGFNRPYSIPQTFDSLSPYPAATPYSLGYPSPNGVDNEGSGGDFLDSFAQSTPARNVPNFGYSNCGPANTCTISPYGSNFVELNDAAIGLAFTKYWLPYASGNRNQANGTQLTKPWFCAVSFVNPHDISSYPWSAGMNGGNDAYTVPYQPAFIDASAAHNYSGNNCPGSCSTIGDEIYIGQFLSPYSTLPAGLGNNSGRWNWENLSQLLYANNGKPGFQLYFQNQRINTTGNVGTPGNYNATTNTWSDPTSWTEFLNYYAWLQSCVDYQVGQVLGTNPLSATVQPGLLQSSFNTNTVVIFTSDHGDYGGSHGLHAKGGAVYDESLNVPFYVSFPSMRNNSSFHGPALVPFTCSSVDLLPFVYELALGNAKWRNNSNDMIYYLRNRESIFDAINLYNDGDHGIVQQRRLSEIPLHTSFGANDWEQLQPFILHTADDYSTATGNLNNPSAYSPSHVIAFRTVDITDPNGNSAPFYPQNSYGGGKLGVYGYWNTYANNNLTTPIYPINNNNVGGVDASNQYEFYNYSPNPAYQTLAANPQEVGNQYFDNGTPGAQALAYVGAFNNNGSSELYTLNASGGGNSTLQVQAAIQEAVQAYLGYLKCAGNSVTGNNGRVTTLGGSGTHCGYYLGLDGVPYSWLYDQLD